MHPPTVVCLHSSTATRAQWRGLAGLLAPEVDTLAFDLHGHGSAPAWPDAPATLAVDADRVLALAGAPADGIHLVGHSYGGAVALQIALAHTRRVRSLTLYEPVAFGILRALAPDDAALAEIEEIAHTVAATLNSGDTTGAARTFVNYWGGAPAWDSLGPTQRASVEARLPAVPRHFDALFRAAWDRQTLAALQMPILVMQGSATRASARRVAQELAGALPHVQRLVLPGAGHLGPITHGPQVNAAIAMHLAFNGVPVKALHPQPQAVA
jgi:pimeloyl-ACP methyl ester carboxylesterase